MEIPESISTLTTDVQSDYFAIKRLPQDFDILRVIDYVKQSVNITDAKSFEEGLLFYKKDIFSDKTVLKNFMQLYAEVLKKTVAELAPGDEQRLLLTRSIDDVMQGIECNLNILGHIFDAQNKQKNNLDASRISFIMLGYAIAIIKKIYNN